jgi:hypothetical protein
MKRSGWGSIEIVSPLAVRVLGVVSLLPWRFALEMPETMQSAISI